MVTFTCGLIYWARQSVRRPFPIRAIFPDCHRPFGNQKIRGDECSSSRIDGEVLQTVLKTPLLRLLMSCRMDVSAG